MEQRWGWGFKLAPFLLTVLFQKARQFFRNLFLVPCFLETASHSCFSVELWYCLCYHSVYILVHPCFLVFSFTLQIGLVKEYSICSSWEEEDRNFLSPFYDNSFFLWNGKFQASLSTWCFRLISCLFWTIFKCPQIRKTELKINKTGHNQNSPWHPLRRIFPALCL